MADYDRHDSKENGAAVRSLVKKAGYDVEELEFKGEEARCCGFGGDMYSAGEKVFRATAERSASLSESDYVTYCVNCRDCFAAQGKAAYHILDLILVGDAERCNRPPAGANARRENRRILKERLLREFFGEEWHGDAPCDDGLALIISEELRQIMDRRLIKEENVRRTIMHGLETKRMIHNRADESFFCHLRQGVLTYYAQFTMDGQGVCTLLDAYCHRMTILEAAGNE